MRPPDDTAAQSAAASHGNVPGHTRRVPFTVSHVAAVLPGARTALPAAALVVGAMSPDIPYFLPRGPWTLPTHTVGGIVLWAPLLGAMAVAAWYLLLARAAYAWVPQPLRRRLPERATARERLGSLRAVALVYAALVISAATHVVWDAFTHNDGWVVERVPALMRTVAWLPGDLAAYRWAQYASSVLGMTILVWWIARWWRTTQNRDVVSTAEVSDRARWYVVTAVVVSGIAAAAYASSPYLVGDEALNLRRAVFKAITVGTAAAVLVVLAVAVGWTVAQQRRPRSPA
jgi:putative Mn2+ efflux pump MntP